MPKYRVTGPDGNVYNVTAPEGASQADIIARVSAQAAPAKSGTMKASTPKAQPRSNNTERQMIIQKAILDAIPGFGGLSPQQAIAAADSVLGGFGDRITGAVSALTGGDYTKARNEQRAVVKKAKAAPGGAIASVAGAALPMLAMGGAPNLFAKGAPLATKALQTAKALAPTALSGAVFGAGRTENLTDVRDLGNNMLADAGQAVAGDLAGRGLIKAAGRVLRPATVRPEVQRLAEAGVVMTPGQRGGPVKRWLESANKSIPGAGTFIRGAERRGLEQFNRAWINEALAPVKGAVPDTVPMGPPSIAKAQEVVSDAFARSLAPVQAPIDTAYDSGIAAITQRAAQMPPEAAQTFEYIMQNEIAPLVPGNKVLNGEAFQNISRQLRDRAAQAGKQGSPAGDMLADNLLAAHDELASLIGRNDPNALQGFMDANDAYANMARVNDAFTRTGQGEMADIVTPSQAYGAVKKRGYGTTTNRVAAGEARMQSLVNDARRVLPDTLPNSGTPERGMYLAALAGSGGISPVIPIAGGLAALPYIPAVTRGLQQQALNPSALRFMLGQSADKIAAPAGALVAGSLLGGR